MQTLLGIDLGTSSIKAMLLDTERGVIGIESQKYDVEIPAANCAEQNPDHWWNATIELCSRLKKKYQEAFGQIRGIGLSGQMHGLVTVDKQGNILRPAIIWLDQRSCEEVEEINQGMTEDEKKQILHNRIYPGFAFPSLLWIKKHEPDLYGQISKIMQPKDYIRYKLTGYIGTDVSDASATAMFDVGQREWAWAVIRRFGIPEHIFADCHESTEIAGMVTSESAVLCGLQEGIPVVFGCGDQMAQSIGNGVIGEGCIVSNIGTGGQISTYADKDIYDRQLRTHTFCHALNHAYTVFGATLSCGLSLKWLTNQILEIDDFEQCNELASQIAPGSDGIIYLPYLSGERTPIMNAHAKGVIYGFKLEHDKRHMIRAVMEGIIYSLKDSLDLLEDMGIRSNLVIASGGGSVSKLLLQMQADIFEKQIKVCNVKEQACLGACMLAGIGTGVLKDIESASRRFVTFSNTIYEPDPENCRIYRESFKRYHELYNSTKIMM